MSQTPESPEKSVSGGSAPALREMPRDELEHLAGDIGVDPTEYTTVETLAAAVSERRQLVEAMDRGAMLEVVQWGRRPVPANVTKQQLAVEIARIKSMRFDGLSPQGLLILSVMRGVRLRGDESEHELRRKLKRQEGFMRRFARKRRAWIGSVVSNMLGMEEPAADYQFLPPQPNQQAPDAPPGGSSANIKEEIEETGLFSGIASRVKRQADTYLNQKLDEIEARIDRKLDEIDRRLGEWRDKEVANRIRILKITLWASVAVAAFSLIYLYVRVYFVR